MVVEPPLDEDLFLQMNHSVCGDVVEKQGRTLAHTHKFTSKDALIDLPHHNT